MQVKAVAIEYQISTLFHQLKRTKPSREKALNHDIVRMIEAADEVAELHWVAFGGKNMNNKTNILLFEFFIFHKVS